MPLKNKFLTSLILILWVFSVGHCLAECFHTHPNSEIKNSPHHHHHHDNHNDNHNHSQDTSHGTPCEISVALPSDIAQKILFNIDISILPLSLTKLIFSSSLKASSTNLLEYPTNLTSSFTHIRSTTARAPNAPPLFS